jgi:catalase
LGQPSKEFHDAKQTDPVMRQPKRRLSWAGVPIDRRSVLLGFSAIGGFLAVDLGAVLYAGGWMAGERLTPQAFMDAFKRINGSHPGFRRNHATGVAVAGYFDSTAAGQVFSKAAVFRRGRTPVVGRFSLTRGNPNVADTIDTARGLALAFGYPGGEQWRTAMLNLPVFLHSSPQGFYDRLVASKFAPGTGKPDPEAMARFLAARPEAVRAMALHHVERRNAPPNDVSPAPDPPGPSPPDQA